MTTQFISFLVIIAVLVIDFVINGRKKAIDETQKRIEGNEGLKKFNLFEYLLLRKKNVVVFILFIFLSKPILHTSFFPDTKEVVNFDRKLLLSARSKDFYIKDEAGNFIPNNEDYYLSRAALLDFAYTKKGEKIRREMIGTEASNYFYHPLETINLSFNEHLELMFKSKLWIFLVSLGTMGIIVFLFNDKINAR